MPVSLAYLGVILIWSTTPLAIQWSTQGTGFAFAVFSRMLIGVIVGTALLLAGRIPFPLHRKARLSYLVGGLGLLAGMGFTYWAARHVYSGLISVMFGLSPLVAGVMAAAWLGERSLTRPRLIGAALGVSGLAVIFLHGGTRGGPQALAGLGALLIAVVCYTAAMVWLKRIGDDSPPLATTVGTLSVSLPGFALLWWLTDGTLPDTLPLRAGAAIVYLGVFGSVIGFALYYYCIRHMEASRVALITLMTPVLALLLGQTLNGEETGPRLWAGTALILTGLAIYQWESLRGWQRGRRERRAGV
ncbi:DMT family transporter [Denitromonas iodatirespirans]|uniref:DMT family transporter n=1 Tax=Denitromonas iodatirespirans TaxID=2795389 RepID=A0A944DEP8_DENI1|nr:DMT family transporter [Denitromonas iodatirespirans]MBT0963696.1 DMT family transporter [Denitromonas iodatirespirans]